MIKVDDDMVEKRKNGFILGLFFLAVFFLRIFYISKVKGPFVYADEMGYWGHAANLTGNTWAGVMNGMPWYAFGYSLLLAPVFLITTDIVLMYRIAIVANAALGLLSFYLAYKAVQRLQPEFVGVSKQAIFAFTAVSFSAYIFNSYIAWSETLLSFLVWMILYEFILLEESPRCWKGILLGITAGYSYMVHNRMLAVVAAVLFILIFLLWNNKIKVWHAVCVIGSIAIVFCVNSMMKQYLNHLLTDNVMLQAIGMSSGFSKSNSLSEQVMKLRQIFTLDGFENFILNVLGQVWQALSATYLLAGFGIAFCTRKAYMAIKKKELFSLYLFPVMALAFTILMTSLFFIDNRDSVGSGAIRIDTFFYGRYNDIFMGLLVMMALLWLDSHIQMKAQYKLLLVIYAGYLLVSIAMYYSLKDIGSMYINTVSAASIYIFHWLGEFSVLKCTLTVLLASVLYLLFNFVKLPKRQNGTLICVMLFFLFFTTAFKCMRLTVRGENDYTQQYAEIFDFLNENTEEKEPVYTFSSGKFAYDLQTRLVDKMVISINADSMNFDTDRHYVVMSEEAYLDFEHPGYSKCLQTQGYVIVQKTED